MPLFSVGVNHKTAPVEIRERVAFVPARLQQALRELTAEPGVHEAAILSTCNRTEIYCHADGPDVGVISAWLARHHELPPDAILPYL